jgi:hypothetical protein
VVVVVEKMPSSMMRAVIEIASTAYFLVGSKDKGLPSAIQNKKIGSGK